MPRSYDSLPPAYYGTPAPSATYGTVGSTPQSPSEQSRQTHTRSSHDPAATETSSLWTSTVYPRRSPRCQAGPRWFCAESSPSCSRPSVRRTRGCGRHLPTISPRLRRRAAAVRKNSRLERNRWAAEKGQWGRDEARHQDEVAMWGREREEHLMEHDAFKRERVSWERECLEEERAFEREKAGWARQRQKELDAFEREKEEWARQRVEEDRHKKEIEWRRRGAYWTEPWAANFQCSGYGTRPYSAHLLELPGDVNWLEACMDMPIKINGQWVGKPYKCQRDDHNIWGTWSVNGESQCVRLWDALHDMGCSPGQMGMRRYEAHLMDLRHGEDWDIMCRTTPATIGRIHFDSPTSCEDKNDRTGVWDVPDGLC